MAGETYACANASPRFRVDGELIPADAIHRTELASLNDEFGEVLPVARAVERLR